MKLIFATNNQHKVEEVKAVLPAHLQVVSLKEAGIDIDIPEPHLTLEENATEKATTVYHLTNTACFSEDTGLEVKALNGAPGVRSARYAGENASFEENIHKLLQALTGQTNRVARFRTVICYIVEGTMHYFEGRCTGRIVAVPNGAKGFGYDPVFVPDGSDKTFAEMTIEEKNTYSHRRKAMDKLVAFLSGTIEKE